MTKQKYNSQKLRYFSRSSRTEKTKDESLIEETVLEWYDAKHRAEAKCEIDFINEISVSCCPYCSSSSVVKNGFNNEKVQRYKCKNEDCGRTFNNDINNYQTPEPVSGSADGDDAEYHVSLVHGQ